MKTFAALVLLVALSGCASVPKYVDQVGKVRDAINNLLPSDFTGDVDMQRNDSYFDITLKAGGLHKNKDKEWTWDWVDFDEQAHFPILGFAWVGHTRVKLGKQP